MLPYVFFLYKYLLILVDFEVESHATSILQQGNINQEVGLITNPDVELPPLTYRYSHKIHLLSLIPRLHTLLNYVTPDFKP